MLVKIHPSEGGMLVKNSAARGPLLVKINNRDPKTGRGNGTASPSSPFPGSPEGPCVAAEKQTPGGRLDLNGERLWGQEKG